MFNILDLLSKLGGLVTSVSGGCAVFFKFLSSELVNGNLVKKLYFVKYASHKKNCDKGCKEDCHHLYDI